jgi:hypothetical protein
MATTQVLPRPNFQDRAMQEWAMRLVDVVQRALDDLSTPPRAGIVLTSVVPVSAFNAATATPTETAQAFGTLLKALQVAGRVT